MEQISQKVAMAHSKKALNEISILQAPRTHEQQLKYKNLKTPIYPYWSRLKITILQNLNKITGLWVVGSEKLVCLFREAEIKSFF